MRRKKSKLDRNICGPQSFEIVILSAALTHCRCHPRSSIIAGGGATRFVNPPQHLSTGQSKWRSDEEEERTRLDILGKIHYEMNPLNHPTLLIYRNLSSSLPLRCLQLPSFNNAGSGKVVVVAAWCCCPLLTFLETNIQEFRPFVYAWSFSSPPPPRSLLFLLDNSRISTYYE